MMNRSRKATIKSQLLVLFCFSVVLYSSSHAQDASIQTEKAWGEYFWAYTVSSKPLLTGTPHNHLVDRIMRRLQATQIVRDNDHGFNWDWKVVNAPQVVNAESHLAGKFLIYSGLDRVLGMEEPLWAAVLAHEVAHSLHRHSYRGWHREVTKRQLWDTLRRQSSWEGAAGFGAGAFGFYLLDRKFDRDEESHADELGLSLMAQAGYDPRFALEMQDIMRQKFGDRSAVFTFFFRSHPRWVTRTERTREVYAQARQIYESRVASARPVYTESTGGRSGGYSDSSSRGYSEAPQPSADLISRAEQGDVIAQLMLGSKYEIVSNYPEAVMWYRKASENGSRIAPFELATLYEKGRGVPQDFIQAYRWYYVAENRGVPTASDARARVVSLMTGEQITQAHALLGGKTTTKVSQGESLSSPKVVLKRPDSETTRSTPMTRPVFTVGGAVSAPKIIYQATPDYSVQAREAGLEGKVVLTLVVQKDGSVRDVRVMTPLGMGLDEKAIEAVRQWRFQPGTKGGQPVDVAAMVEVIFRLLQ